MLSNETFCLRASFIFNKLPLRFIILIFRSILCGSYNTFKHPYFIDKGTLRFFAGISRIIGNVAIHRVVAPERCNEMDMLYLSLQGIVISVLSQQA